MNHEQTETSDAISKEFYCVGWTQIRRRHPGTCVLPSARLNCNRCDIVRTASIPNSYGSSKGPRGGGTDRRYGRSFLDPRRRCEGDLSSGDPVADNNARDNFVAKYDQMHRLAYDDRGRVILYLGADNWPFPIPLVKSADGWIFDSRLAKESYSTVGSVATNLYYRRTCRPR